MRLVIRKNADARPGTRYRDCHKRKAELTSGREHVFAVGRRVVPASVYMQLLRGVRKHLDNQHAPCTSLVTEPGITSESL